MSYTAIGSSLIIEIPSAFSILVKVSSERFSRPLNTFEMYCGLQFIFSANCFWLIPSSSILSSISMAIFCECLSHDLFVSRKSNSSRHFEGVGEECYSSLCAIDFIRFSILFLPNYNSLIYSINPSSSMIPSSSR